MKDANKLRYAKWCILRSVAACQITVSFTQIKLVPLFLLLVYSNHCMFTLFMSKFKIYNITIGLIVARQYNRRRILYQGRGKETPPYKIKHTNMPSGFSLCALVCKRCCVRRGAAPVRITHGSKAPREHLRARELHGNESL